MKRTLMISPIDLCFLTGTTNGVNKVNKKDLDFSHIVYSSMIICGVDKIYAMEDGLPEHMKPSSTSTLINCTPPKGKITEWIYILDNVVQILKQYNSSVDPIRLASFLANLIYALDNNVALITPYGFNELSQKLSFSTEIDIPISLFVNKSIEASRISLPNIRMDIQKDDVYRLTDVIQSKQFHNYKEAHQEIENGGNFNMACNSITIAGNDLINTYGRLLVKNNNIFIGGIEAISDVIETFLGKIFQKGFDVLLKTPITKILKDYKRIPIYSYDIIANDLMMTEVKEWIQKNQSIFKESKNNRNE